MGGNVEIAIILSVLLLLACLCGWLWYNNILKLLAKRKKAREKIKSNPRDTYKNHNAKKRTKQNSSAKMEDEYSQQKGKKNAKREQQNNRKSKITNKEAYVTLNLQPGATITQLKTAYREKIRKCHPDQVATMDEEIKKVAEEMTKRINEAYATLLNLYES